MPQPPSPEQVAMREAAARQAWMPLNAPPPKKPQAAALGTDAPVADAPVRPVAPPPAPPQPEPTSNVGWGVPPDQLADALRQPAPPPPEHIEQVPFPPAQIRKARAAALPQPAPAAEVPPITMQSVGQQLGETAEAGFNGVIDAGKKALELGGQAYNYVTSPGEGLGHDLGALTNAPDVADRERKAAMPPEPAPPAGEDMGWLFERPDPAVYGMRPLIVRPEAEAAAGFTWEPDPDEATGTPVIAPTPTGDAQKALDLADQRGDLEGAQEIIGAQRGTTLTPVEDHRQVEAAGPLENPAHTLEAFGLPQTALWMGAYAASEILPDPGTPAGDVARDYAGKAAAVVLDAAAGPGLNFDTPEDSARSAYNIIRAAGEAWLAPSAKQKDPTFQRDQEQIGRNAYDGFVNGTLLQKALDTRGYETGIPGVDVYVMEDGSWETELPVPFNQHLAGVAGAKAYGGWRPPQARGIHVIDTLIPPELARELAAHAPSVQERTLYANLTTDAGRELAGLALEFAIDPLWLFGAAKGAETIYMGDKAYTLMGPVARLGKLAAPLNEVENATGLRHAAAIVMGEGAEVEEAEKFFNEAIQKAAGRRGKYAFELEQNRTPITIANDRVAKAQLAEIQRGLTLAQRARGTSAVTETGSFAFHLPGGNGTYFASKGVRKAAGKAGELLELIPGYDTMLHVRDTGVKKLQDWYEPYSEAELHRITQATLQRSKGESLLAELGAGQVTAYYALHALPGFGVNLSRIAWDAFAKGFGTRWMQPLMGKVLLEAEPGKFTERIGVSGYLFRRLERVPQEDWLTYNRRVSDMMRTTKYLENDIMSRVHSGFKAAEETHTRRKVKAARELQEAEHDVLTWSTRHAEAPQPVTSRELANAERRLAQAKRWNDPLYSVREVWEEAWEHHEAGSGKLGNLDHDPTAMAHVVSKLDDLRDFMRAKYGLHIDEITQSLVAMSRWGKGDLERKELIDRAMKVINDYRLYVTDDLKNLHLEAFQRAATTWLERLTGLQALRDDLGLERLAEILERIREIPPGQAGYENAIRALLKDILRSKTLVQDVLQNAAIVMQEGTGESALRTLAALASMQTRIVGANEVIRGSLLAGIEELLQDWEKEASALKAIGRGEFFEPDVLDAMRAILDNGVEMNIADALAIVGKENWEAFVAWADSGKPAFQSDLPPALAADFALAGGFWADAKKEAEALGYARTRKVEETATRSAEKLGDDAFTKRGLLRRRLEEALSRKVGQRAVPLEYEQARDYFRQAVQSVLTTEDDPELTYELVDQLSKRLAVAWGEGGAEGARAVSLGNNNRILKSIDSVLADNREGIRRRWTQVRRDMLTQGRKLKRELKEVTPRFEIPDNKPVPMKAWQAEMQNEYQKIMKQSGLSPYDQMRASFAATRNGHVDPAWVEEHFKELEDSYGQVVGARYGTLPNDIEPVVKSIASLVASYEELYVKHGFDFLKDPYSRLRDWGVDAYAPHILDNEAALRKGGTASVRAAVSTTGVVPTGVQTLDERLSTDLAAAKVRKIRGTIREISHRANDSHLQFSVDPELIVTRYLQTNRAIGAKEFLLGLVEGGVARLFPDANGQGAIAAAQQNYVPLLRMKKSGVGGEAWARWFEDIPEIARAKAIEELKEKTGIDPLAMFNSYSEQYGRLLPGVPVPPESIWKKVATELNKKAGMGPGARTSGEHLHNYYTDPTPFGQLYVPQAVYESMRDLYDLKQDSLFRLYPVDLYRRLQNWWKTRYTVVNVPFSTRNLVTNNIANIIDVGLHGAMSPRTQGWASQLATAVDFADTWGQGSLERAYKALTTPGDPVGGSLKQHIKDKWAEVVRTEQLASFRAQGLPSLLDEGIDLGDGFRLHPDEALKRLREGDVVSPSFTQFVDIAAWEQAIQTTMLGGDVKATMTKWLSRAEDGLLLTFPIAMAGGVVAPVALPKSWGKLVARRVENQARLINFRANMLRSGGNFEESYAHVAKFLFDYGDLNQFQRTWMRLAIPFFVWNQKNVLLHLEMMQKSPAFYNKFRQIMLTGGHDVLEAWGHDADPAAQDIYLKEDPYSDARLAARPSYARSQIVLPITPEQELDLSIYGLGKLHFVPPGMTHLRVRGLGTQVEAFSQIMGSISSAADLDKWSSTYARVHGRADQLRLLGNVSFLALTAGEWGFNWSTYFNKPVTDLRNPVLLGEIMKGTHNIDELMYGSNAVPVLGPSFSAFLREITNYEQHEISSTAKGLWETEQTADPQVYYFGIAKGPYGTFFNNAAALTEAYHLDMAADAMGMRETAEETGTDVGFGKVPRFWRWVDAYWGAKLQQDNEELDAFMLEKRTKAGVYGEGEVKGAVKEYKEPRLR